MIYLCFGKFDNRYLLQSIQHYVRQYLDNFATLKSYTNIELQIDTKTTVNSLRPSDSYMRQ